VMGVVRPNRSQFPCKTAPIEGFLRPVERGTAAVDGYNRITR